MNDLTGESIKKANGRSYLLLSSSNSIDGASRVAGQCCFCSPSVCAAAGRSQQ